MDAGNLYVVPGDQGMDLILGGHYNPIYYSITLLLSDPSLYLQTGHSVLLTAIHGHTVLSPTVGLSSTGN